MTDSDSSPIVDAARLGTFLDGALGGRHETTVEKHTAGFSNETFFVYRDGQRYVLRRPPRGPILPTAHDVVREYRFLHALHGTAARVPRPVVLCEDVDVVGAPFYLMERKDGFVIRAEVPAALDSPADRHRIGLELADALAELHSVDWQKAGLTGKAEGYIARQVKRWKSQADLTVGKVRQLPELDAVSAWIASHQPPEGPATVVHGDYKLDNVMFAKESPARLIAIFDWEMATIGDPLADLGWLLHTWGAPDPPERPAPVGGSDLQQAEVLTGRPGFATREEIATRYAEKTGRAMKGFAFYHAMALWKLAIILEGLYVHYKEGTASNPGAAEFEFRVPALIRRAQLVIERG